MSVLLDALKKAAEEKKNADGSDKEISSSEVEQNVESTDSSVEQSGVKFDLPKDEMATDNAIVENIGEESPRPKENTGSLSGLNLKIDTSSKKQDKDELVPQDPNDNDHENMSEETSSLLAALEADDGVADTKDKNVSQTEEQAFDTNEDVKSSKEVKNKEDFEWSMDDLPAYSEQAPVQQPTATVDSTTPLQQNPILTKGEHTAHKTSRFSSSLSLIVTLFVVLMFIGIGFYGMLYYQEQSDKLEFSMKKYNLQKMEFTQPAANSVTETTGQKVASEEQVSAKNDADTVNTKSSDDQTVVAQLPQTAVQENSSNAIAEVEMPEDNATNTNSGSETIKPVAKMPAPAADKVVKQKAVTKKQVRQKVVKQDAQEMSIASSQSMLASAYEDYRLGNDLAAVKKFSAILEKNPSNLNALLGMGAIASASSDYDSALMYYQRALQAEPNDIHTIEAIAVLSGLVELDKEWENDLKEMAFIHPESAVLQYAVGNIYANKSDWLKAQQHYFNAYAVKPDNPDYLVNLAISFDHLGKYDLATQYYTQALALADTTAINFNASKVRDRLISIRQLTVKGY